MPRSLPLTPVSYTHLDVYKRQVLVLVVGIITAFAMSVVAIKFLMGYIKKNDFTAFGWYRIVVGVLVLGYFVFESMGMLP